jgi:ribonuclease HI
MITTSTDALLVLAGLLPIEYLIEERVITSYFSLLQDSSLQTRLRLNETLQDHLNAVYHVSSLQHANYLYIATGYKRTQIIQRIQGSDPHPGLRILPNIKTDDSDVQNESAREDNTLLLYTDASKQQNANVGTSVVIQISDCWFTVRSNSYHPLTSIFEAELFVIEDAIDYIKDLNQPGKYEIRSDSKSALYALQTTDSKNPVIQRTSLKLNLLLTKGIDITLQWVKGHSGIPGNEAADAAAKWATKLEPAIGLHLTKTLLKSSIRKQHLDSWQRNWSSSDKGRLTHTLFSKVSTTVSFMESRNATQRKVLLKAASGHFPVNDFLQKIRVRENSSCPYCRSSRETLEHLIVRCPRFMYKRFSYTSQLKNPPVFELTSAFRNPDLYTLTAEILLTRLNIR